LKAGPIGYPKTSEWNYHFMLRTIPKVSRSLNNAAQGCFQMAVEREDYPQGQISKEEFASIQRAIGRLLDQLTEEGFTSQCG
jgi:hypothetical protein